MPHTFEHLETILRAWEDYWFIDDVLTTSVHQLGGRLPFDRTGAAINYATFRSYLNALGKERLVAEELSRFAPPVLMELPPSFVSLHASLATWCRHGRTVYVVSAAIQSKLSVIPLRRYTWTDIPFPHTAFAVTLEQPVTTTRSRDRFDLILVGPYLASTIYSPAPHDFRVDELRAFRSSAGEYQPLTSAGRKILKRYARHKKHHKLVEETAKALSQIGKIASLVILMRDEATGQSIVKDHSERERDPTEEGAERVQEVIARLCLYLADSPNALVSQTFSPGSPSNSLVQRAQVYTVE